MPRKNVIDGAIRVIENEVYLLVKKSATSIRLGSGDGAVGMPTRNNFGAPSATMGLVKEVWHLEFIEKFISMHGMPHQRGQYLPSAVSRVRSPPAGPPVADLTRSLATALALSLVRRLEEECAPFVFVLLLPPGISYCVSLSLPEKPSST